MNELKTCLRFAIRSCDEKLRNVFAIVLENCEVFVQKSLSLKKCFERKNSQTIVCCLCVNLPNVKIWGQSDKFPMSFNSLRCPLQVKNWLEKTVLNLSIRPVIFTSEPPCLCQYLIFFNGFFFTLQVSFGSLLKPKNRNLKKIADLKVYCIYLKTSIWILPFLQKK